MTRSTRRRLFFFVLREMFSTWTYPLVLGFILAAVLIPFIEVHAIRGFGDVFEQSFTAVLQTCTAVPTGPTGPLQ